MSAFDIHVVQPADVFPVHCKISELSDISHPNVYLERIGHRKSLTLLAVSSEGAPMGFKLGYAESDTVFYSWVGGVLPEFRGSGVALALLKEQEIIVHEWEFKQIHVKSMNRYPAMLKLLISSGYKVSGYEEKHGLDTAKIHFLKDVSL